MNKFWTGIGSRETPSQILRKMTETAKKLPHMTLRSGGAKGADTAFAMGTTNRNLYYPWPRFSEMQPHSTSPSAEAFKLAAKTHPAWDRCSQGAQKLHARNCHQILGDDLKTPSEFVLYWTKGGEMVGGTATALKIAQDNQIPCIWMEDDESLKKLFISL